MSSTPKVSVYVPIYNVAPFIERCARSLFEQTLEDLNIYSSTISLRTTAWIFYYGSWMNIRTENPKFD